MDAFGRVIVTVLELVGRVPGGETPRVADSSAAGALLDKVSKASASWLDLDPADSDLAKSWQAHGCSKRERAARFRWATNGCLPGNGAGKD